MREIKFRGRKSNGEWIYGDLVHNVGVGASTALIFPEEAYDSWDRYIILTDTIGQFTGLFDKNGKEIYEGDILRGDDYPFYDAEKDSYNYYAIVEWDEEAAQFYAYIHLAKDAEVRGISQGIGEDMENLREMEVIGNIHDNPELLNK